MSTTASIHLDTHHHVGPVDPRIFGGFLEHLGRAVYEGAYDPANTHGLIDEDGFRTDVLAALKPLGMPVMRYPGGNYVSAADWKDGVGPRDKRPRRPEYAWRSIETNQFGTDEFMKWCAKLGTEPMMAVNLGTAGAAEAAHLVEYCNLQPGTFWADRRKQNGRAEPYGAKLWCLGNEMDGPWQAGHVPAEVYGQRAQAASIMMKGLDPTIQTVACGSSGLGMATYLQYDRTVLEYAWNYVDYISAHRYSNNDRGDTPWYLAEGIEIERVIEDYAGLLSYVRGVKKSKKQVTVSFDEWNVWYKDRNGDGQWKVAPHLLEEVYNFEDALVCAQYLSAFVRRADVVKVACIAQVVNVIAPILTRPDGLLIQPTYYPMALFAKHAKGVSLRPAVTSPNYKAGERGDVPALDTAATFDAATGAVAVFLVNRDASSELTVDLALSDRTMTKVTAAEAMGGVNVKTANTWEKPDQVKPFAAKASIIDGKLRVTVPAPGFVALNVATVAR